MSTREERARKLAARNADTGSVSSRTLSVVERYVLADIARSGGLCLWADDTYGAAGDALVAAGYAASSPIEDGASWYTPTPLARTALEEPMHTLLTRAAETLSRPAGRNTLWALADDLAAALTEATRPDTRSGDREGPAVHEALPTGIDVYSPDDGMVWVDTGDVRSVSPAEARAIARTLISVADYADSTTDTGSGDSECAPIARWNRPRGPFPPCVYAACDYHEWAGPQRDDLADVDHDIEEHRADTGSGDHDG